MAKGKIFLLLAAIFGAYRLTKDEKPKTTPATPVKPIRSILFLGDSNTAMPETFADQFARQHPQIYTKRIAKIGEKTSWMLKEFVKDLKSNNRYDVICVLGGSNDIYALDRIDSAKENLNEIYKTAKASGAVVVAITPPNKDFFGKRTEHKQRLLHELINWIQANPLKDHFINFHSITNNRSFFSAKDNYLHALPPAHTILKNRLAEILHTQKQK